MKPPPHEEDAVTQTTRASRKKPSRPTPEEYGKFIKGLELRDVLLIESCGKRKFLPTPGATLGYSVKSLKPIWQVYADGFTITATYDIQLTQERDEREQETGQTAQQETFGSFRIGFEMVYASNTPLTEAYFEIFKQVNLPVNVWPYVRQHIHQQSVLMGLPALVLPVHRTP